MPASSGPSASSRRLAARPRTRRRARSRRRRAGHAARRRPVRRARHAAPAARARAATAKLSVRRCCHGLPSSVRATPEWTTTIPIDGGIGIGSTSSVRQSMRTAQPGDAGERRQLILDAARHAQRDVLGLLRDDGELAHRERDARSRRSARARPRLRTPRSRRARHRSGWWTRRRGRHRAAVAAVFASVRTTPAIARPHAGSTRPWDRRSRRPRCPRCLRGRPSAPRYARRRAARPRRRRRGRSPSRRRCLRGSRPDRR